MSKVTVVLTDIADVTVASAGTAQPLTGAQVYARNVTIQWHPSNVGNIYLGGPLVAAGRGLILNALNPVASLSADDSFADDENVVLDLNKVFIDAANTGDKVKVAYIDLQSVQY